MDDPVDLYTEAARIIEQANDKKASLKTLIYSSQYKNIRQLFALVNECSKYQNLIREVLALCPKKLRREAILQDGPADLLIVLLYEHLLGRNFGRTMTLRKLFQQYKTSIQRAVEDVLKSTGAQTLKDAIHFAHSDNVINLPRYMRVNLIKSSVEVLVNKLVEEGWTYVGRLEGKRFVETVRLLTKSQFGSDPFLHDVLVFPSGTDFHDHHFTKAGIWMQQDRASCVPAHALSPAKGSVVLDCCAAPGNKTTHLASLMGDEGRVVSLDRDAKRMNILSAMVSRSGARCVHMVHQDFMTVQPDSDDAQPITAILVDPSCSGSGMIRREDAAQKENAERIQTLKRFQITILKHALRFPSVQRVVYSTCSKHKEENEEVVTEVMSQVSQSYQFEPVLSQWGRASRGLEGFPGAQTFLRLSPEQDLTQGFFVACFVRLKRSLTCSDELTEEPELENKKDKDFVKKKKKKTKQCLDDYAVNSSESRRKGDHKAKKKMKGTEEDITVKRKPKKRKHVDINGETHLKSSPEKISKKKKKKKEIR